ncbi:hypothetical protein EVAR_50773_1 [Eumeta japonica]|uniref:Uncharacterized protein n=1 Tax=Eumeta variegata TaxID=151549 RepID=A0A4C1WU05_EUMVA|nr:hypothetical protein EVAR_50773_1 [Eumeta japonica]
MLPLVYLTLNPLYLETPHIPDMETYGQKWIGNAVAFAVYLTASMSGYKWESRFEVSCALLAARRCMLQSSEQ